MVEKREIDKEKGKGETRPLTAFLEEEDAMGIKREKESELIKVSDLLSEPWWLELGSIVNTLSFFSFFF